MAIDVLKLMQGDSRLIPIEITLEDAVLKPELLTDLEVCIGPELRKSYAEGDVLFDEAEGLWFIRVEQRETYNLDAGLLEVLIRPKFKNGELSDVHGVGAGYVAVMETHSKEVL